jgi:hypothetical protein
VLRLPATRNLSLCYAVAFGGLVGLGLYLPAFLRQVYQLTWHQATLTTAACLTVAAASRPAGGWLCGRHNPVTLLGVCFFATAVSGLVMAFEPAFPVAAIPVLSGAAVCLGTAAGAVQALVGASAPPDQAGTIAGAVGAVGGLAGILPPLLLTTVHGVHGSYGIALTILAGAALAGAVYLRIHRRWIGAALIFPAAIAAPHTGTTVVILDPAQATQLTASLAVLATRQEVVIVSRVPERVTTDNDAYTLVAGLRLHLPHHHVAAVVVGTHPHSHEVALIAELLHDGGLPVVLATTANPDPVAVLLARSLGTNNILNLTVGLLDRS